MERSMIVMPKEVGLFKKLKTQYEVEMKVKRYNYERKDKSLDVYVVLRVLKHETNLIVSVYRENDKPFHQYALDTKGTEKEMWETAKQYMLEWTEKNRIKEEIWRD